MVVSKVEKRIVQCSRKKYKGSGYNTILLYIFFIFSSFFLTLFLCPPSTTFSTYTLPPILPHISKHSFFCHHSFPSSIFFFIFFFQVTSILNFFDLIILFPQRNISNVQIQLDLMMTFLGQKMHVLGTVTSVMHDRTNLPLRSTRPTASVDNFVFLFEFHSRMESKSQSGKEEEKKDTKKEKRNNN